MSRAIRLVFSLAIFLVVTVSCAAQVTSVSSVVSPPQSSTESAVRAVVEKYLALYAARDLDGLMKLWSEKSPDNPSQKRSLLQKFAAEGYSVSDLALSGIKLKEDHASLRATFILAATDLKSLQKHEQRTAWNFALVREDGEWKVWRSVPAENDLAETLVTAKTEAERSKLLETEKTLVAVPLVRALINLGIERYRQGNYTLALECFEQSVAVGERVNDREGTARAVNNIGIIYYVQGDYPQALERYRKNLEMNEALNDKPKIANALNNIGNVYYQTGNNAKALEYYEKSRAIREAVGDRDGLSLALGSIGNVYLIQGNHVQALEYFQKSLAISEALDDKAMMAVTLDNIGLAHGTDGNYAQALDYLQRSLTLREKIGDNKEGVARTFNNIGNIHFHQGKYVPAVEYYEKSLALREALGEKDGIATTLGNLARVNAKEGHYALALDFAERAAALARQIGDTDVSWRSRVTAGNSYRALKRPLQAKQAFEDAITDIETLRANIAGGGDEQQRFFESKVSPYYSMVDLLIADNNPAEALAFAERAKARVLLNVLQSGHINITKAMTSEEREQEHKLQSQLVLFNNQISRESASPRPDKARLSDLGTQLEKARLDLEDYKTHLYAAHPELRAQRGDARSLKLDETAGLLSGADGALLEYVVTDDRTHLFVITESIGKAEPEVHVYTLEINRDNLAKQVAAFRQQLADRDLGFRASAAKLYGLLLRPAQADLRGKTNLVIVPDDTLWDLPFQSLLTGPRRFLIEDAAISYAPSLTVLREMTKRKNHHTDTGPTTLLALGNPTVGKETVERASLALRDEKLAPLPEAEQEVKALSQLYGPENSKVYVGPEAREDLVKKEAGRADILHFATHGTLNNASPMYSHLVLAQGDSNEDGLLEAWEIMQLDLKADLAILSACETARGRYSAGEGMIGLTWAMFVAGVPTTVVSQWKVEAASTRDLLVDFHRGLRARPQSGKTGESKAQALRHAALSVMRHPETSHPFYWAGFVLVGDGR